MASNNEADASEIDDHVAALEASADSFEHDESMILTDEDIGHVYPPPPHLAKRFYRSAINNNRRRTSAASSRRNSLSSISHPSTRTYYRVQCQSKQVAQHLRRTSIIESRKARLADRAAHVEQVRLRAALVKSTPRVSNTEEKALAAQQAREKMLAKVAASCAEEVNRAKKVAEEAKERRAEEQRRARLELEEKHAEAERRRNELRKSVRKPRTASIPAGERRSNAPRHKLSNEDASRRIQSTWRRFFRRKMVKEFLGLGLSIERIWSTAFEEATTLLDSETIISTTGRLMNALQLDAGPKGDETCVRSFLSAFMIISHATEVFNKHGQQEEDLIGKAKELLISFEAVLSEITESAQARASPAQTQTLFQSYSTYIVAFQLWKQRDASVLIGTMIDQFVALDAIWQTVKDDTRGEVATDYREAIREQQVMLLSKIKRLAGAERANTLIKRAIRESRRARTRPGPIGDVRPREVPPATAEESTQRASAVVSNESSEPTPPREGPIESNELLRVFSVVPPNRVLVHELLLDPRYRIEPSPQNDPRDALNREVCESMRHAVENDEGAVWTLAVAENIRTRLLKLLKPGNSLHKLIAEVLDGDHVRVQCEQGQFSYERFFSWMADLLPRLCAPIRDNEVKTLATSLKAPSSSTDVMIEKLFGLLHVIDLMSLDYTNYMLQQAAPTLIQEAPAYEQRLFQADVSSGVVTLERTRRWWRHASLNAVTEPHASVGANTRRSDTSTVYARGLLDLAINPAQLTPADVPETLELDRDRLARIRADILKIVTVGSILSTAKNLLKRDVRSQWKAEAKRIYELLSSAGIGATASSDASTGASPGPSPGATTSTSSGASTSVDDSDLAAQIPAIISTSHPMPSTSLTQLGNITARFLVEARSGRLADPVLRLLFQRLRGHMSARLLAAVGGDGRERARVASQASEGLAGIGLAEFIGQVGTLADELSRVRRADWEAHCPWYLGVQREMEVVEDAEE